VVIADVMLPATHGAVKPLRATGFYLDKVWTVVNSSMSEKIGPIGRTVLSRVLPVVPLLLFAFVALVVGFVASTTVRQPYETPYPHLFFSDTLHMKAWLLTAASLLSLGQLLTASRIYEVLRFPPKGRFYHVVHRWSGRIAILLTLPAAYDCIFLLGFETNDSRVHIHSLLGSFLYGAVLAKILIVRSNAFRGWALPLAGGVLFSILLGLWLTSAFWLFSTAGIGL
jgi:hypothetical protein